MVDLSGVFMVFDNKLDLVGHFSELINVSGPHTWVWKLLVGLMLVSCEIIERRQFFISTRSPVGRGVGSWAAT